jgi:putative heme-binding domain-containing protein
MLRPYFCIATLFVVLGPLWVCDVHGQVGRLETELKHEGPAAVARAARESGDAARGAVVFHQAHAMCAKCHSVGEAGAKLTASIGPNLASKDDRRTDALLVEAILEPSKVIADAYRAQKVRTVDGRTLTGIIAAKSEKTLTLSDLERDGKLVEIPLDDIEEQAASEVSAMPAGVANQLASRQQFLDLVRYLIEIREGGAARAKELTPPPGLLGLQLPEYESRVDHAGMIKSLDDKAFARGRAIYEQLCINCHGTHDQAGSLPTSLRFAEGKFKNGSDPFAMYQTLTRGFGLMAPQAWMVPQQKYDVIHYVRRAYLEEHNPSQHFAVDDAYLAGLPKGDTRGPAPKKIEPWATMDYGPALMNTYEVGSDGKNFAYKGIAVRLDSGAGGVSRGRAWMVFDHDTMRVAVAWTGSGFIDWNGIHFNGRHQIHPRIVGDVHFAMPTGPGWANPETGSFRDDARVVGRDGRNYGPLPRAWARYKGMHYHNDRVVVDYSVGNTEVREMPGVWMGDKSEAIFTRTINIGPRDKEMLLAVAMLDGSPRIEDVHGGIRIAQSEGGDKSLLIGTTTPIDGSGWKIVDDRICLSIPAGEAPLRFVLWTTKSENGTALDAWREKIADAETKPDLGTFASGGPGRWLQKLTTQAVLGDGSQPFAVDVLTHPEVNPWLAQTRLTGIDFLDDADRAVVCAWDGDVWLVSGLSKLAVDSSAGDSAGQTNAKVDRSLTWQRIASGLFQPLGIKVHRGKVYVTCRDQLVVLHDQNGDEEIDYFECFNNDHQVTEHFHEFAMGLQIDDAGNFYYAKSARHALKAVVPHHGTLLRISPDGAKTDILATGFRAANGVCLNDDGTFVVTDQEGHWNPKNRINWVKPGGFYGNMFGYHDVTDSSDSAMEQPLCWITNGFDRSPAELLWTPKDAWGPLAGSLLNLSYGYGKVYVVPFDEVNGHKQGGMCALPIGSLPTGVMRGRFHPVDRQLYTCGMFAWAGSATQAGGLYRIRYTGKPMHMPAELKARKGRIEITFTDKLDAKSADKSRFAIKTWSLERTANYGSEHHDEKALAVDAAELLEDGRTIRLVTSQLQPTWGMEIVCRVLGEDGSEHERVIHGSVFAVGE